MPTAPSLRLFLALRCQVPKNWAALGADLDRLEANPAMQLRRVPAENLHITIKFFGTVSRADLPLLIQVLEKALQPSKPFAINLKGLDAFSNALWLGVDRSAALDAIAAQVSQNVAVLGYDELGQAGYQPHVTVARLGGAARSQCSGIIEKYRDTNWGKVCISAVHLYRSQTLAEGARYTVIHSFGL